MDTKSFVMGYAVGYNDGLDDSGGQPSEDWTPPADWLNVPEPGAWEAYFLVDMYLLLEFGLYFLNPDKKQPTTGKLTVDWGDGKIESFEGVKEYTSVSHTYEAEGQYLIKATVDEQSCILAKTSDYSGRPAIVDSLLIVKLGENICLDYDEGTHGIGVFRDSKKLCMVKINGNSKLPQSCFAYCTALKKIDFKNPPTIIPRSCFSNAYCLKENSIDLSKVTEIEDSAFSYCYSFNKINLLLCTSIGENGFLSCYTLQSFYAPFCTGLGRECFAYCNSLSELDVDENCTFGDRCFYDCYNLYPRPDGSVN
ncbi:MAG: leucine-rich repeat protein [Oscillospiraceae bacterium]|nr:leucine-rich repeat protein [Oscillospiraceae bacterium]